jgi:hypothetical protein
LIRQLATTAVVDTGQLPGRVVAVLPFEQHRLPSWLPSHCSSGRPVTLQLLVHQLVALMAHDFAVQVIALVGEHLVLIEGHAQQVAAAVGQPADLVPSGRMVAVRGSAHRTHAPYRHHRVAGHQVVLMLAGQVAGFIMEPLQLADGIERLDQLPLPS